MWQTGISARNARRRQRRSSPLTHVPDDDVRTPADRPLSEFAAMGTIARYGMAWPLFVTREMLAAWDDLLAFWMNVILGDDWEADGRG
jgi:hypothetical protein